MIPKTINYCWFGGKPLPPLALKCIESWKKYLPDYEIKQWNETNFDVNVVPYTSEAYKAGKYPFVSDYARFHIMYNYGGLYFDTDVELVKPIDDIVEHGAFMGCETRASVELDFGPQVNPGLGIGAEPGMQIFREILDYYGNLHFIRQDGEYNFDTVVVYTSKILNDKGLEKKNELQLCAGIWIYPKEYFCPKDNATKKLRITDNTRSIHHYSGSWITPQQRFYKKMEKLIGFKAAHKVSVLLKKSSFLKSLIGK